MKYIAHNPIKQAGILNDVYIQVDDQAQDVINPMRRANNSFSERGTAFGYDAGQSLGRLLTPLKPRSTASQKLHLQEEIIKMLNQQEEIAMLNREAARLERLARIQERKTERINNAVQKAMHSTFI